MKLLPRLAALGIAATAGLSAGLLLAAKQISGPWRPNLDYGFTPFEVGIPAEELTFHAPDGTRLSGWWFDNPDSDQVVICCHGHRGNKSEMLGIGPGLWREGFNVMVFDFRGNGDSADGPQSLAHFEQQDLRAAIDLAVTRRPDAEIDLVGFSMGAAIALLVATEDPRIAKVVADSSFADMHGVVAQAASNLRLPAVPLVSLIDQVTGLRYGYRFDQVQPVQVIADLHPRPLLMFHGTKDRIIPVEHADRLLGAAGPNTRLELTEGVDHCGSYFADRRGYISTVAGFLRDSPTTD